MGGICGWSTKDLAREEAGMFCMKKGAGIL